MVSTGDKWAKFYSELAADEELGGQARQGIALSRFCGFMVFVIKEMKAREDLKKCLNPKVLEKAMTEFGYTIIQTLVTDIAPDHKVKTAMNEINAAQRARVAAQDRAELATLEPAM